MCCEILVPSATLHSVTSQKAVHIQTVVRFTIPTAVAVVWDVITMQLAPNVGIFLSNYMVSHPMRQ